MTAVAVRAAILFEETASGVSSTPGGARAWARLLAGPRPLNTDRDYTRLVRRLLRQRGLEDLADADGRLLAVGWNKIRPTTFIEMLPAWLAAWDAIAARPIAIASKYNPVPVIVFGDWLRSGRALARARARMALSGVHGWTSGEGRRPHPRQEIRAGRALARQSARALARYSQAQLLSPRLWATLGRLSPEGQSVVLAHLAPRIAEVGGELPWEAPSGRISDRDVDWPAVAPQLAAIRVPRVAASYAMGRRQASLLGLAADASDAERVAALAPAYPAVPLAVAAQLVRGVSPVELAAQAGSALTRAQAHRWLRAGAPEILDWRLAEASPDLVGLVVREPTVVDWLIAVRRDPARWEAITRPRTIRGPAGEAREVVYLDRVDELAAEDIPSPGASVDAVYRRAATRYGNAWLESRAGDHRILCPVPPLPIYRRAARWLRTPAALVAEGRALDHCAGGYIDGVDRGTCWILALRVGSDRSTVEMDPRTHTIRQHYGPRNDTPAPVLTRLLARMTARWEQQRRSS